MEIFPLIFKDREYLDQLRELEGLKKKVVYEKVDMLENPKAYFGAWQSASLSAESVHCNSG